MSRAAKVRKVTDKHTIGKRTWQTCKKNAGSGEGCVVFSSFLTRKPWSIERISKGSCANQGGFVQEMTPSITITTGFWRIYMSDFAVFVFRLLKHPQRKKEKKKHSMWAEPRNKPWGGTKPPGKVGADIGTAVKNIWGNDSISSGVVKVCWIALMNLRLWSPCNSATHTSVSHRS